MVNCLTTGQSWPAIFGLDAPPALSQEHSFRKTHCKACDVFLRTCCSWFGNLGKNRLGARVPKRTEVLQCRRVGWPLMNMPGRIFRSVMNHLWKISHEPSRIGLVNIVCRALSSRRGCHLDDDRRHSAGRWGGVGRWLWITFLRVVNIQQFHIPSIEYNSNKNQ